MEQRNKDRSYKQVIGKIFNDEQTKPEGPVFFKRVAPLSIHREQSSFEKSNNFSPAQKRSSNHRSPSEGRGKIMKKKSKSKIFSF